MINVPNNITPPLDKNNLNRLNRKVTRAVGKSNVLDLNLMKSSPVAGTDTARSQQTGARGQGQQTGAYNQGQQRGAYGQSQQAGAYGQGQQTGACGQGQQRMPGASGQVRPAAGPTRPAAGPARPAVPPTPPAPAPSPQPAIQKLPDMQIPPLLHPLRKGQKTALAPQGRSLTKLKACFGWNILDARCDMDASAFLLAGNGRVPGDDWFVFYSQTESPDMSVRFSQDPAGKDREVISIDLGRLNPSIQKIVFVLTINEAFENDLNFSMLRDAYIRLLDENTNQELISYSLEEYYPNVTSLTIGELYLHNGQWKFNPVGNGVHQDLAGQCAIYGVEVG